MIQDHTIDQTLIELARTMKALKALRAARKGVAKKGWCPIDGCKHFLRDTPIDDGHCHECGEALIISSGIESPWHAAATRASMDLTRKLADLRQGR